MLYCAKSYEMLCCAPACVDSRMCALTRSPMRAILLMHSFIFERTIDFVDNASPLLTLTRLHTPQPQASACPLKHAPNTRLINDSHLRHGGLRCI
jgi:hypothetical protein